MIVQNLQIRSGPEPEKTEKFELAEVSGGQATNTMILEPRPGMVPIVIHMVQVDFDKRNTFRGLRRDENDTFEEDLTTVKLGEKFTVVEAKWGNTLSDDGTMTFEMVEGDN